MWQLNTHLDNVALKYALTLIYYLQIADFLGKNNVPVMILSFRIFNPILEEHSRSFPVIERAVIRIMWTCILRYILGIVSYRMISEILLFTSSDLFRGRDIISPNV